MRYKGQYFKFLIRLPNGVPIIDFNLRYKINQLLVVIVPKIHCKWNCPRS